jgi:hypothetical protein
LGAGFFAAGFFAAGLDALAGALSARLLRRATNGFASGSAAAVSPPIPPRCTSASIAIWRGVVGVNDAFFGGLVQGAHRLADNALSLVESIC